MSTRDLYHSELSWQNWKANNQTRIKGISQCNSDLILAFLNDMEIGSNTSPHVKKGQRCKGRLLDIKSRLLFFVGQFNDKDLRTITKLEIHQLFQQMREGVITKMNGQRYKGTDNFVKDFKAFWNWLLRTERVTENIIKDLQSRDGHKPDWVYLSEDQFKILANNAEGDYRTLMWFMYDTGARVTEAYSIRISDFSQDFTQLHIRDEYSKTFGRIIKLKLSPPLIREYVKIHQLGSNDYFMIKKAPAFNKYLRTKARKLFGSENSPARKPYGKMRIYDIRHNACCYWLKRYQKTRSLMYRMGWSQENMVRYYSEFLGLADDISDEDMLVEISKTDIEKRLIRTEQENEKLKEQIESFNEEARELKSLMKVYLSQTNRSSPVIVDA